VCGIALLMYAWLAMFSLIGGVLFERRLDIGLDDVHTPEGVTATTTTRRMSACADKEIDRIYAEWRGGAHAQRLEDSARARRQEQRSDRRVALALSTRSAVARWPSRRSAGARIVAALLVQRSTGEALDVVRERLRKNARSGQPAAPTC
jgi:hypothetical protein